MNTRFFFYVKSVRLVKGGAYVELWTKESNSYLDRFGQVYVPESEAGLFQPGNTIELTLTDTKVDVGSWGR